MSRRSMSLSPIRTESGANLRTANWTRMKFKPRGGQHHFGNKQNYYNNNRVYHHDNNNRGYHYDNNRYHHHRYDYKRNFKRDNHYEQRRSRSRSRSRQSSRSLSWSSGNRSPAKNLNESKARDLPSKWDSPQRENGSKIEIEKSQIVEDKNEKGGKRIKRSPAETQPTSNPDPPPTTMTVVDPSGKLVTMVCVEMIGPDGKMMKVLQMPQDVTTATKVTGRVAPVTEDSFVATATGSLATEEILGEKVDREKYEAGKLELEEKQRRRKEIIRTRLWPRPATWKDNGNTDNKDSKDLTWALNVKSKSDVIPGLGDSPKKEEKEEYLSEMDFIGHKIPTLGNNKTSYPEIKTNQTEYVQKIESIPNVAQQSNQQSNQQPSFNQQLQTTYPNIGQGFHPTQYVNSVAPPVAEVRPPVTGVRPPVSEVRHPVDDLRHPVASKWESPDATKIQSLGKKSMELTSSDEEIKTFQPRVEIESSSDENQKKKKKKKKRKSSTSEKKKKKKKKKEMSVEKSDKKSKKEKEEIDDITRIIAPDLPLSHIRNLVARRATEGSKAIFSHIPNLSKGSDSYETQFVSLFGGSEEKQSPLMSRKMLKKTKVTVSGSRSVTHMTLISLSERISNMGKEVEKVAGNKQTVSVNLKTLDFMKIGKNRSSSKQRSPSRSPQRSLERSRSPQRSLERSRSPKRSLERSRSPRKSLDRSMSGQRSLDRSRSNQKSEPLERSLSPGERSRSPVDRSRSPVERSRSKSLPRAYNSRRSSSRESIHKRIERNRNQSRSPQRGFQQRNYPHYNQRYRGRGRGFRGRWNNNYHNYNNNRGRGFHNNNWRGRFQNNNNHHYDNNRHRNFNTSDKRFNRSRSRSLPRDKSRSVSPPKKMKMDEKFIKKDENSSKDFYKPRKSSPLMDTHQWTHDKFEEAEKEEI